MWRIEYWTHNRLLLDPFGHYAFNTLIIQASGGTTGVTSGRSRLSFNTPRQSFPIARWGVRSAVWYGGYTLASVAPTPPGKHRSGPLALR